MCPVCYTWACVQCAVCKVCPVQWCGIVCSGVAQCAVVCPSLLQPNYKAMIRRGCVHSFEMQGNHISLLSSLNKT